MKKLLLTLTGIIAAAFIFAGGVFASQWLSFTGDNTIQQSQNDVDEIMQILRDVNQDKLSAEDALAKLQELNPEQLVEEIEQLKTELANKRQELENKQKELADKDSQIQEKIEEGNRKVAEKQAELDRVAQERDTNKQRVDELQQQINENDQYVKHLEQELTRANEQAQVIGNKTTEAVEEARTYKQGVVIMNKKEKVLLTAFATLKLILDVLER